MYRATIISFLRQRRTAAKNGLMYNSKAVLADIEMMLRDFDTIRSYPDRRQAFEIWKKADRIINILPSEHGKQSKIRNRILELLTNVKEMYDDHTAIPQ